jgi:regulatory protein YycH of two-component signal transduction system YycFG
MATAPGIIEQKITAGSQWTGETPDTTPVDELGIRKFPTDVKGGLFSFDFATESGSFESYVIDQIMIDFADATSVEVAIINSESTPDVFVLSTTVGEYLRVDPIRLTWDERIRITSVGATAKMYARVMARPGKVRPAS